MIPVATDWTYRDYIALEQRDINDPTAEQYFAAVLEDTSATQLPQESEGASHTMESQKEHNVTGFNAISSKLIDISKQLGVPLQSVLLAGHLKVISLMSGFDKALSCVTVNGRPEQEGAEDSIGLFLNSLPFSYDMRSASWRALITSLNSEYTNGFNYRRYPLSIVQQQSGMALDEVLFNYTHFHVYDSVSDEVEKQGLEVLGASGFEQTNYGLVVYLTRMVGAEEIDLAFAYDSSRYSEGFIKKLGDYYEKVFTIMQENLDDNHFANSFVTDSEKNLLIESLHSRENYNIKCIHQLVESQALKLPNGIAIECDGEILTYSELNDTANQLAHHLLELGLNPGDLVGVCANRSLDMVISLLAVLKGGGAYVPLDPEYPDARLQHISEDCGFDILITQQAYSARFTSLSRAKKTIEIDSADISEKIANFSKENLTDVTTKPDNLAYVVFTSGSTGKPKGVLQTHSTIVNVVLGQTRDEKFKNKLKTLQFASFSFDVSIQELATAWFTGSPTYLLTDQEKKSLESLPLLLAEQKIERVFLPPLVLNMIAEQVLKSGKELPELQQAIVAGEALVISHELRDFMSLHRNCELHNHYGPTEGHCVTAMHVKDYRVGAAPIGKPLANVQCYILNKRQQLVTQGAIGELYFSGAQLAKGYFNLAEQESEKFVANPFSQSPGAKMYRTGDFVRYRQDGVVEYLGRIDDQVKVRGFRIELGEIESKLAKLPSVNAATVIAKQKEGVGNQLLAYVTLSEVALTGSEQQSEDEKIRTISKRLRDLLYSDLPSYMVPSFIYPMKSLPITANGKIDKGALPEPDLTLMQETFIQPEPGTESELAEIWSKLLEAKTDEISATANFFELGGHSLLVIKLISEIREHWQIELPIQTIMESTSLKELATQIYAKSLISSISAEQNNVIGADEMEVEL
ncbi:Linear gramicidin synthase subunit D [Pseudoalteromonas sp. P1-9]|nr:Linear gramicidin synthase subunit D [Pseudoalteromonas sp. P1-9]